MVVSNTGFSPPCLVELCDSETRARRRTQITNPRERKKNQK